MRFEMRFVKFDENLNENFSLRRLKSLGIEFSGTPSSIKR